MPNTNKDIRIKRQNGNGIARDRDNVPNDVILKVLENEKEAVNKVKDSLGKLGQTF
ncbi:21070_t:CDS:2 [Entrophospora sp. SA101]|nr:21070_t:CDS:2 [Entrophospora sp. SA101]